MNWDGVCWIFFFVWVASNRSDITGIMLPKNIELPIDRKHSHMIQTDFLHMIKTETERSPCSMACSEQFLHRGCDQLIPSVTLRGDLVFMNQTASCRFAH